MGQPSRGAVVISVVGSDSFLHLDERHREQIDRRGQAKPARPLRGT